MISKKYMFTMMMLYEKIQKIKQQLSLKNYDAIFIRRGDKLSGESNFINTEKIYSCFIVKKNQIVTQFFFKQMSGI